MDMVVGEREGEEEWSLVVVVEGGKEEEVGARQRC